MPKIAGIVKDRAEPKMDFKDRLSELQLDLLACDRISEEDLASKIIEIGFQCQRCGDCCTGEDNSVVVFPSEIRLIIKSIGGIWLDIAQPPSTGEWDIEGNFHTLEWRLRKKNESCKFYCSLKMGSGHGYGCESCCRIYDARPVLCSTYPFYLDEEGLQVCECRGLGKPIDMEASREIARRLISRRRKEIMEAIALTERFEDFERCSYAEESAVEGPKLLEGKYCIVHDSEGKHLIPFTAIFDLKF